MTTNWTPYHADQSVCDAHLDCHLSHAWRDLNHAPHANACLAWALYPGGLLMPVCAYAEAVTLAMRLDAETFLYHVVGFDHVSALERHDGAESGYRTTHQLPLGSI